MGSNEVSTVVAVQFVVLARQPGLPSLIGKVARRVQELYVAVTLACARPLTAVPKDHRLQLTGVLTPLPPVGLRRTKPSGPNIEIVLELGQREFEQIVLVLQERDRLEERR